MVVGRRKEEHVAKVLVAADDRELMLAGVIGNVLVTGSPQPDVVHIDGLAPVRSDQCSGGARETGVDKEIAYPIAPLHDGKRFGRSPLGQKRYRLEYPPP